MGLADFLAEAGGNTVVGHAARAAGGRNTGQRGLDTFINQELPAFAQEFEKADPRDAATMSKLGMQFIQGASRAGIPPAGAQKLLDMLAEPAMKSHAAKEYGAIRAELSPKAEGRPEGVEGPAMQSGNFLERPASPFTQEHGMRLGETEALTGVKIPAHLAENLRTPAMVQHAEAQAANQQASADKTRRNMEADERAIAGLSNERGEGGVSPQEMATLHPAGLTQFNPQREPAGATVALKEREFALKQQEALGRIERGTAAMATAAERADAAAAKVDLDRQRLAFDQEKHRAGMTTEVAPGPVDVLQRTGTINKVAQEVGPAVAGLPPNEQSDALKKAFHAAGYEVDGDLSLAKEGGFMGWGGSEKIRGITDFRPRSRVTIRRPAGQGRYSEGMPTGSAPMASPGTPAVAPKELDAKTAAGILQEAGGDKDKARALAKQRGFRF